MAKWVFEPSHSAAEFRARHMMITWVRGSFKNMHGTLDFDPSNPTALSVEATIDTTGCWTGDPTRDNHLRSPDFLDTARYPTIHFKSTATQEVGPDDYRVTGDLTIRDVTHPVTLDLHYLGQWLTPWWEDGVDKGPRTRAGFTATTRINRYDFGVNWNDKIPNGGVVVSLEVSIDLDVEAIKQPD
jgi:polyisoprenoid-binding protein YceI